MPPRVLIVDDERAFAEILVELISSEGYVAECVHTGLEALSVIADDTRAQPDVLICDVMLPEMRGDQLAIAVRERYPTRSLPVLLLSAGGNPHVELRDVWFLSKPLELGNLLSVLKGLIASTPHADVAAL